MGPALQSALSPDAGRVQPRGHSWAGHQSPLCLGKAPFTMVIKLPMRKTRKWTPPPPPLVSAPPEPAVCPSPAGARGQAARPAGRAPSAAGGSLKAPIHGLGRPRGPLVAPAAPEVFARCQKKRRTQVAAIKRPFYGRGLCDSVTRQTPTVSGPRRQRPLSSGPRPCLAVPRRPPTPRAF